MAFSDFVAVTRCCLVEGNGGRKRLCALLVLSFLSVV